MRDFHNISFPIFVDKTTGLDPGDPPAELSPQATKRDETVDSADNQ
jgi:hypothetical protein